jgi:hypothetical protein
MEKDFHFGVTYVVARLAEFDHPEAETIATACQYVDDTVNTGILKFKNGERFYRRSTAHEWWSPINLDEVDECGVWVPFHFLPGNDLQGPKRDQFYNQMICHPGSSVATAMLRSCIVEQEQPFRLHRLGIVAHVYADTWAHQGFAGVGHRINSVSSIRLLRPAESSTCHLLRTLKHRFHLNKLKLEVTNINPVAIWEWLRRRLPPIGHSQALSYPDHPFRRWSYLNCDGKLIVRNNPRDFVDAAEALHKFFCRFRLKDPDAVVAPIPVPFRRRIAAILAHLTDDDAGVRNDQWLRLVSEGRFGFERVNLAYRPHGPGSWKRKSLGIDDAVIRDDVILDKPTGFDTSDWKLFHDAANVHRSWVMRGQFHVCTC